MIDLKRRISSLLALVIAAAAPNTAAAEKKYAPGITDTEIKIGQTMPYSGPACAWGAIGLAELAYFKMINDRGGIGGRKIKLISLDDAFSPPKTVEQTRKLVEQDGVAFIYGSVGPGNLAIRKYLNDQRVPPLFVVAPVEYIDDPQHFPWTMGLLPPTISKGEPMRDTFLLINRMPGSPCFARTLAMSLSGVSGTGSETRLTSS
jgi:branched-chain amino acid transport system substrate-binding protein